MHSDIPRCYGSRSDNELVITMTSGSSVHRSIREAVSQLESGTRKLYDTLSQYENEINTLTEKREDILFTLATTYLPDMTASSVRDTLKDVRSEVQGIFMSKQERRKELETLIVEATDKQKELQVRLDEVTSNLSAKADERNRLSRETDKVLAGNTDYVALKKELEVRTAEFNKNLKVAEIYAKEAKKRLPDYERNELFNYLLERGFGTEEYHANPIARSLDGFVAKVIDYAGQKKDYDIITLLPEQMEKMMKQRRAALEELARSVSRYESQAAGKTGLAKVIADGTSLGKSRDAIMAEIDSLNSDYSSYVAERKSFDNGKDEYHTKALKKLKDYLKGYNITELKELARKTPGTEDDELVDKLERIDKKVRDLKDSAKETKAEINTSESRLEGLKDIESKYRRKDFESSRSYFSSGFDFNTLLQGYLLGRMDSSSLWHEIDHKQKFKEEEYHSSYRSSSSNSSSSYHSSDSGFGGGGFSSGGGFGGGGFSSGSGF